MAKKINIEYLQKLSKSRHESKPKMPNKQKLSYKYNLISKIRREKNKSIREINFKKLDSFIESSTAPKVNYGFCLGHFIETYNSVELNDISNINDGKWIKSFNKKFKKKKKHNSNALSISDFENNN